MMLERGLTNGSQRCRNVATVGTGNTTGQGVQCRHGVAKKKKCLEKGEEANMLVGEEGWREMRLEKEFGMMLGKR